jgi:hypothetical protein
VLRGLGKESKRRTLQSWQSMKKGLRSKKTMCMRLEQGGVVLKRSRLGALRSHQRISLLVPVSPPITDVMSGGSGDRQNQAH